MTAAHDATGPHRFEMDGWIRCAPFERHFGLEIVAAEAGRAVLRMPFRIELAQGGGLLHGGALVSLADTAVVMAIKSLVPPRTHFATTALEARFLAPVRQGVVTAEARVSGREGRILRGHADVLDGEGRTVMAFDSTFKIARDAVIQGVTFRE
jgi:uncharacterized protein (TIGR00369 family)